MRQAWPYILRSKPNSERESTEDCVEGTYTAGETRIDKKNCTCRGPPILIILYLKE